MIMLLSGEALREKGKQLGSQSDRQFLPEFNPFFDSLPEPETAIEIPERGKYTPRNVINNLTGTEWIKFTRSWFIHRPPPRNKENNEHLHPAKFPEDLVANFISFFTKEGQWVLDPFGGTGSTLVACEMTRRNGIAVELTEKWAEISANRAKHYTIHGDSRHIPEFGFPPIDFSFSSPPYWDMLAHSRGGSDSTQKDRIKQGFDVKFSESEHDLGNVGSYDEFMEMLLNIYDGIKQVLRPKAYIAVVIQNQLKEKQEYYPIAWDFAFKMREHGWKMCQEFIWCQRDKKLGIWGYPNTYISNVHHHYILIFRKS